MPFENRKNLEIGLSHKLGSSIFFEEKAIAPHSSTLAWKIPWTDLEMDEIVEDVTGKTHRTMPSAE